MSEQNNGSVKEQIIQNEKKSRFFLAVIGVLLALIGFGSGTVPMGIIGGVLLIVYFIPSIRSDYPKSFKEDIAKLGITAEQAETDLADGQVFTAAAIGRRFMLIFLPKARLVALRDLIWCYGVNTTTQYRVYGIIPAGKGKSSSLKLVCRDRSELNIASAQGDIKPILQAIKSRVPGVIVGYSKDIENAVKTDFASAVSHVDGKNTGVR